MANNINRCAVIGNPIQHSRSPQIHQHFAGQFDMPLVYERIQGETDSFEALVQTYFSDGGRGLNITTPFKEQAFAMAQVKHTSASAAKSGNTLWMADERLHVASTDGEGWYRHIQELGIELVGKRILILGAGGAGRVIIEQLRSLAVASEVVVANRTVEKLTGLQLTGNLTGSSLDDIPALSYDLIINSLSTGWQNAFPDLSIPISADTLAYDLNYADGSRSFRDWFHTNGGKAEQFYDGWGMLVCQAALSFELWWGKTPAVSKLIQAPELAGV